MSHNKKKKKKKKKKKNLQRLEHNYNTYNLSVHIWNFN